MNGTHIAWATTAEAGESKMNKRDNQRNTHRMGRYGYAGSASRGASRGVGRVAQEVSPAPGAPATSAPQQGTVGYTSAASFDQDVLMASKQTPVLVDVTASWCGPCRALAPLLENLADRYRGRLSVLKLDGDKDPVVVQAYGVRAYPTLLLFSLGQLVQSHPGSPGTLAGLMAFVEPFVKPAAP